MKQFRTVLRNYKAKYKYTVKEMSRKSRVSERAIYSYLGGDRIDPPLSVLRKFEKVFGSYFLIDLFD